MVYDLGGGTFDVSVIEIGDGVVEVLATAGNNHLGGDDFDQRIMNYLIGEFKKAEGIDLSKDQTAVQRIKEEAEKAKKELGFQTRDMRATIKDTIEWNKELRKRRNT